MAGSVSVDRTVVSGQEYVVKHTLVWTSDAAGAVSGNSIHLPAGTLLKMLFKPGAGGVQPLDLYDITLVCIADGVDMLNGDGANKSNVNATYTVIFSYNVAGTSFVRQWLHGGLYELVVANAGNAKQGTLEIYIAAGKVYS